MHRALDLKLDREVALKVLPTELVADPERKRRFYEYWKNGDMDRERMEKAKNKTGMT